MIEENVVGGTNGVQDIENEMMEEESRPKLTQMTNYETQEKLEIQLATYGTICFGRFKYEGMDIFTQTEELFREAPPGLLRVATLLG